MPPAPTAASSSRRVRGDAFFFGAGLIGAGLIGVALASVTFADVGVAR
jgi:hypothetical protein